MVSALWTVCLASVTVESYFKALTWCICAGISNHYLAGIASRARQFVPVSLSTFIFCSLSKLAMPTLSLGTCHFVLCVFPLQFSFYFVVCSPCFSIWTLSLDAAKFWVFCRSLSSSAWVFWGLSAFFKDIFVDSCWEECITHSSPRSRCFQAVQGFRSANLQAASRFRW